MHFHHDSRVVKITAIGGRGYPLPQNFFNGFVKHNRLLWSWLGGSGSANLPGQVRPCPKPSRLSVLAVAYTRSYRLVITLWCGYVYTLYRPTCYYSSLVVLTSRSPRD